MRRSQRLDKMALLDLQSNLQSEIQAKEAVKEELRNTKAQLVAAERLGSCSLFAYSASS